MLCRGSRDRRCGYRRDIMGDVEAAELMPTSPCPGYIMTFISAPIDR